MTVNPQTATVSVPNPGNVTAFHFKYLGDGGTVAELVQTANHTVGTDFEQDLRPLNALVAPAHQGSILTLTVRSVNQGVESTGQFVVDEEIKVISAPDTPTQVILS